MGASVCLVFVGDVDFCAQDATNGTTGCSKPPDCRFPFIYCVGIILNRLSSKFEKNNHHLIVRCRNAAGGFRNTASFLPGASTADFVPCCCGVVRKL
jgi:hypothetical protein